MKKRYNTYFDYRDAEVIYSVIEAATGQEIDTFWFDVDAEKYEEFLEQGGAFAGYTPAFVLRKVVISKDINEEFSSTFHNAA